jgi:regulatory protein
MQKLGPHADDPDALAALLGEFQAKGWLSDARAAESLVNRSAAKQGVRRIRQALQHMGVSPDLQNAALGGLAQSEQERAGAVWAKKYGRPPQTLQEKARQMRFLLARGFAVEVVQRTVPQLTHGNEDESC